MYHYDWTPAMLKSNGSLTLFGSFARGYISGHNAPLSAIAFTSTGAEDGWVLESSRNSSVGGALNAGAAVLRLGDDTHNRQYRSILSFDTSGLPDNAIVSSAMLKIRRSGITGGNPFANLGNIKVDVINGEFSGNPLFQASDFEAVAGLSGASTIRNNPAGAWYSRSLPSSTFGYINLTGITQFRLRFAVGDNHNSAADFIRFYSGDSATAGYRPTLIIQYSMP
jgi:hypothetical protein